MENEQKKSAYARIAYLSAEISKHNKLYYDDDAPIIPDSEYDSIEKELNELLALYPHNKQVKDVANQVGAEPTKGLKTVAHKMPMLSLSKVYNETELNNFIERTCNFLGLDKLNNLNFTIEPKIDGLSLSLRYINRKLEIASTRGDGMVGENVFENAKTISGVPLELSKDADAFGECLEIRGEVFMNKLVFKSLNDNLSGEGKPLYANARNAAAGSLRQINPEITAQRQLSFKAWGYGDVSILPSENGSECLDLIAATGFNITDIKKANNLEELMLFANEYANKRNEIDYDIDGLVIKLDNHSLRNRLGVSAKSPRWATALKLPAEQTVTQLLDIEVDVGRGGSLTPVAILQPVFVGGVTISRATLHNFDFVVGKLGLHIGDHVKIQRAGDVIPQVLGSIETLRDGSTTPWLPPVTCPSCNYPININENKCQNGLKCPAQKAGRLNHVVSRAALNIDGLGARQLQLFQEKHWIETAADIFKLPQRISSGEIKLADLAGFGELSVQNLCQAIENKSTVTLAKFLYSIGIPLLGEENAKLMAKMFGTFENFRNATKKIVAELNTNTNEQLNLFLGEQNSTDNINQSPSSDETKMSALIEEKDGLGQSFTAALASFFANELNAKWVDDLADQMTILPYENNNAQGKLQNQKIVFTGKLAKMGRREAKIKAESMGAQVMNTISRQVDMVIAGEDAGSKLKKAQDLGLTVLSEEDWLTLSED